MIDDKKKFADEGGGFYRKVGWQSMIVQFFLDAHEQRLRYFFKRHQASLTLAVYNLNISGPQKSKDNSEYIQQLFNFCEKDRIFQQSLYKCWIIQRMQYQIYLKGLFNIIKMSIATKILLLLAAVVCIKATITVNPISGISSNNLVFSGNIPTSATDSLFFTYYGVDNQTDINNLKNYPLLIIVGNPGTSAQYYSLAGIGPVNLQNDMTLKPNPYTFTSFTNLMFLDLPGCGFSFVSDPNSLPSESRAYVSEFSDAINTFVKESVLGKSSKMVIAGESTFIRSLPGLGDINALQGLIHLSAWPEMYVIGRYYGVAGLDLGIYSYSQQIAIDSTFTTCYNNLRSQKYLEAHQCLDSIFNFIEAKTKNINLFDVRMKSNLTEFLPMVQYYFSQSSIVSQWKAPTAFLFQSQSGYVFNKTYVDMAKNYTKQLSQFMRDYYSVRHWFIQGQVDYISYYKGLRFWVDNELSFVESDTFRKSKLEDIVIDGKIVGYYKAVRQVAYSQILDAAHHLFHDKPEILGPIFKSWLDTLTKQPKITKNILTE